ncbi:LysR family transcriptional regulator [Phenylobacterium sp.]|uniref:LysR family transcriptional regulator n=1 Tax=Phenylobacterium sp. TaxID=1871053 RepID=UPI0025CE9B3F|nr:LysR family transcriptional regulator [Phenylobacterium sp.]MBX3484690.1 LysR family transcriptional regulator [Phenylobacterium sp.]MCW5759566.1 LysR family transcriptional regulator [Phenylobacterium sp.]
MKIAIVGAGLDSVAPAFQHGGGPATMDAVRFDWNDLRFFAAVLEHGSTARAAKAVGVDQTTCARRIAALEQALGLELFARDASGYHPTPAALRLKPAAMAVAKQVDLFASEVETATRRTTGRVKVTSEEYLTRAFLVPALRRFAATHPDVQVEVDASSSYRDLQAGEADIAVRAGEAPDGAGLVRRKLREDPWAVYCTPGYAEAHGAPTGLHDLAEHPLVSLEAAAPGMRALGFEGPVRQMLSSVAAVRASIETGACVGALPQIVAEAGPELRFCFGVPESSGIWLVYPERVKGVPEVRALAACIADVFRKGAGAAAS